MKKVAVYTLGCKVNQYESEGILELFRKEGYEIVNFEDFSDIYIINTCTVTSIADKKSRQMINKAKRTNKDAIIVVMGCYAQISPDEVKKIDGVDLVIGTNNRIKIIDLINEFLEKGQQINSVQDIMRIREFEEIPFATEKDKTRAFIKIQDGCNQFCTYCIIPYTRGPIRSRNLNDIINEVQKISKDGFKEIVLTGIHIESYGKDLKNNTDLVDVINSISQVEGIKRIRLGSLEPTLITNGFINRINREKLCNHFHLSLQSGSDNTLKRMNRKYSTEHFRRAVDLLKNNFTDVAISTDIIVGFPGETDQDFLESYNFAREIGFSKMHVFKFSSRKGTKAAAFPNQVDPTIKEERSKKFIELSDKMQNEFNNKFVGTVQEVLIEQQLHDNEKYFEGLTNNYIRVLCKANDDLVGKFVKVKFMEAKEDYILGDIENL